MSGCGRIDRGYSKRVADAVTWCYDCSKCYHIELAEYGVATRYQAEEDSVYCATFPWKQRLLRNFSLEAVNKFGQFFLQQTNNTKSTRTQR